MHNYMPCASCSLVRLNVYVLKVFMSNKYDDDYYYDIGDDEIMMPYLWLSLRHNILNSLYSVSSKHKFQVLPVNKYRIVEY